MTTTLKVRWPILDDAARLSQLEPQARMEWPAFVAQAGVAGTTDPEFTVREVQPDDVWEEDGVVAVLEGEATVLAGPVALRSVVAG